MKNKEITLEILLKEINEAEKQCLVMLEKLRKQRAELTADIIIEFTISTIHKDKKNAIFYQLSQIDNNATLAKLNQQWEKSAVKGLFGTVKILCLKKNAKQARLKKIANLGGTITVDSKHKIEIPSPDKWWNKTLETDKKKQGN